MPTLNALINVLPATLAVLFAIIVLGYKPIAWTFATVQGAARRQRAQTQFKLSMSPALRERIEQMRADTERLTGQKCSMDDLFGHVIRNYDNLVREHRQGSTFALRHADGTEEPLKLFKED